jgi:predicted kinase
MSASQRSSSPSGEPFPGPPAAGPAVTQDPRAATLVLMVGLPAAGKTTRAEELAAAHRALRLGTSVVLDYGLWGRDERSALRWLARSAGAACQVVYLPVGKDVQLARIAHRQETAPHQTFPITEADVDEWREQFQVPGAAELDGGEIPAPPAGWPGWPQWAADHWPTCTDS